MLDSYDYCSEVHMMFDRTLHCIRIQAWERQKQLGLLHPGADMAGVEQMPLTTEL